MKAKCGVIIIALDALSPNVSKLVLELHACGLEDVFVMPAITPRDLDDLKLKSMNHVFVDSISPIERAISQSHHQARLWAREKGWGWALILEEDAMVSGTKDSLNSMIQEINDLHLHSEPVAIHLFPEQHGLLRQKNARFLYKVYWVPDYAVAYLLNSAALHKSTDLFSTRTTQVADWPDFMRELNWWAPKNSWILHPLVSEEISATQKVRSEAQLSIPLVRKLFSRGYWIGFLLPIFANVFSQYGNYDILDPNLRTVLITTPKFIRRWIRF